ncbi:MAG: O-antigen ligase family protein [Planctomycetaceae bacterium]
MNWLFSWGVALLVTLPVAFRLAEFAGKPVDLVASDLLFLLLIFVPKRRDLVIPRGIVLWRLSMVRVSAAVMLLYCGVLASVAYAESSDMSRVASAIKFAKPLAFVMLGTFMAAVTPPVGMLRRISLAFAGMSVATFVTAVLTPGFPQVAWGKYLFGFPTYGYPNSVMTLFAIMVPFLLAGADMRPTTLGKWSLRGIAGLTGMIVVVSLSRSSTATMACGVLLYLFLTGRLYLPVFAVVFGVMVLMTFSNALDFITQNNDVAMWMERFTRRFSQTVGASDPLSGRGDLWALTIDLWAERPVFGYAFESFSKYADVDTPHQQYLEILYKSGALGVALYGILMLTSFLGLLHLARFSVARTEAWFLLRALNAAFCATMIGNLSQPNLTYSVTGNFLFFALGLALNKHAAAALVTRSIRARPVRSRPLATLPHTAPAA